MQKFKTKILTSLICSLLLTTIAPIAHVYADENVQFSKSSSTYNAWVEISQSAFENNIKNLQILLGDKSKLCAVMKADAYGHGVTLLMPSIIKHNVPCVAIANNQEAKEVRDAGFKGQLMRVRSASLNEISDGLQYDIEELVGDLGFAIALNDIAVKNNKNIKYHFALNSAGMSRNGLELSTEVGKTDAIKITELGNLDIVGIMTHFPIEEAEDVKVGLAKFNDESKWLIENAKLDRSKLQLHTANSFATLAVPESRLDMVRAGGAIYGDTIPEFKEYQRVMQYKSLVGSINEYPKGNTVGYDKTYTLTRDSVLANIPVGYSDGYRRVFTNKGHVLIHGQKAPVLGKVSMNTIMVDVTDIPNVEMLDEVVLFGKQGNGEITQGEVEDINGALLADLYTIWGKSSSRILVN